MENQQIFEAELNKIVGTTRSCEDGSGEDDFTLTNQQVSGVALNLVAWWLESYKNLPLTTKSAVAYINETYPETQNN